MKGGKLSFIDTCNALGEIDIFFITEDVDLSYFDITNDRINLKAATMNRGEFAFECCPNERWETHFHRY